MQLYLYGLQPPIRVTVIIALLSVARWISEQSLFFLNHSITRNCITSAWPLSTERNQLE